MHIKMWCRVALKQCWEFEKDIDAPVTEQVPYGKPTTEALGWPASGPANKRLAMAREEYLPESWLERDKKLADRWKMNCVWKLINNINKNVIYMVYN